MDGGVFVTGTDTGSGKTIVSLALIKALSALGLRVAGFKPVAAGADWRDGELRNDDALALRAAGVPGLSYAMVNPYCFAPAIAPHLAAAEVGCVIDPAAILAARDALAARCDFVVAEGAGGWRVPLSPELDMQALALALDWPVLLVVGLRLGCLNHALLSEQAIRASGVSFVGWIGSQVDPEMPRLNDNIETLKSILAAPCLGVIPHPASREPLQQCIPLRLESLARDRVPCRHLDVNQ